jgi:hypothetical protein
MSNCIDCFNKYANEDFQNGLDNLCCESVLIGLANKYSLYDRSFVFVSIEEAGERALRFYWDALCLTQVQFSSRLSFFAEVLLNYYVNHGGRRIAYNKEKRLFFNEPNNIAFYNSVIDQANPYIRKMLLDFVIFSSKEHLSLFDYHNGDSFFSLDLDKIKEINQDKQQLTAIIYSKIALWTKKGNKIHEARVKDIHPLSLKPMPQKIKQHSLSEETIKESRTFEQKVIPIPLTACQDSAELWADYPDLVILPKLSEEKTRRKTLAPFHAYLDLENPNHICFICGHIIPDLSLTIDHVIPRFFVQEDQLWNMVYADQNCNFTKADCLPTRKELEKLKTRNLRLRDLLLAKNMLKMAKQLTDCIENEDVDRYYSSCLSAVKRLETNR